MIARLRQKIDCKYFNEVEGVVVPTPENLTYWLKQKLDHSPAGADHMPMRQGAERSVEGCVYSGPDPAAAERAVKRALHA